MQKIREYEEWESAVDDYDRISNDADASAAEIDKAQSTIIARAAYLDRAMAGMSRTVVATEVAKIRTTAARDLADAHRDHSHDPETLEILSDLIYGTAELKIESRLTEWTPCTADFMN